MHFGTWAACMPPGLLCGRVPRLALFLHDQDLQISEGLLHGHGTGNMGDGHNTGNLPALF